MPKDKSFKNILLKYICTTSKQPILLKDMLVANRQYNDGMQVDPAKLGFRLKLAHAYLVYIVLVLVILIPLSALTHKPLANIDSHVSILGAMFITAVIFMGFNFFKDKIVDMMTLELIKKSWKLHFPFFSYEDYSCKIDKIFEDSLKEEVSKRDLEKYILDKLATI